MVKASESRLRRLLAREAQYIVPLYQRPYQWDEDDWSVLWNDILELTVALNDKSEQDSHFIGSVVLDPVRRSQNPATVSQYLVIDGQQRLTTLSILLAAIRDRQNDLLGEKAGQKIQNQYLTNPHRPEKFSVKLVPTQIDRNTYYDLVNFVSIEDHDDQIARAYRFFRDELIRVTETTPITDLPSLERTIGGHLSVVSITTNQDDNPHRIFQSLNNTGVKLTQGDLIRNDIFMRLPTLADSVYKMAWLPFQKSLGNDRLENFFALYLAKSKGKVKHDDIFNQVHRYLDSLETEADVAQQVREFNKLGRLYLLILDPSQEADEAVRFRLNRLKTWESTAPHPVMLEILWFRAEGLATDAEVQKSLWLIESLLVRRLLTGRTADGLRSLFNTILNNLDRSKPLFDQVQQQVLDSEDGKLGDEKLLKNAVRIPLATKGKARQRKTFLIWLEQSFHSKESILPDALSIEHVMPKVLSDAWVSSLNQTDPDADLDENHASLVNTLGNLTLSGYTDDLENAPFETKKANYKSSGIRLSDSVIEHSSWGFEDIVGRSRLLGNRIAQEWPLDLT